MAKIDDQNLKIDVGGRGMSQCLVYGGCIAIIVFFYVLAVDPDIGVVSTMSLVSTALTISLAVVAHAMCETLASVFVGLKKPMVAGVTSFILPNLLLLMLAFLFPLKTLYAYCVVLFVAYGIVAISVFLVGPVRIRPKVAATARDRVSFAPVIEHLPINSVVLILFLNANLDIFVLGNFGTPGDLALFGFVFKIAAGIAMLSVAPRMISGPVFAEYHHSNDAFGIKREFQRITALMIIFALLAACVVLVAFPYLAGFVGKYQDHGGIMYAVLIGSVVNVAFGPLLLLLNMTGNNQSLWKYGIGFLIAKLVLLVVVNNYLGLFWYAMTGSIMMILWNLLLLRLTFMRLNTGAGRKDAVVQ